jgi:hypothetical protein
MEDGHPPLSTQRIGGFIPLSIAAREWGSQIGRDPDVLARGILCAFADGEFDGLKEPDPLVCVDPDSLRTTRLEKHAADRLAALESRPDGSRGDSLAYVVVVRTGALNVRPEAIALFAEKRGLEPPAPEIESGGAGGAKEPHAELRPVALDDLSSFLRDVADGQKTEEELKALADDHFKPRHISRQRWREAFGLPSVKKRAPGDTDRTLRRKADGDDRNRK